MNDDFTSNLFKKEREVFETYKKINPQFLAVPEISEKEILSWIGINFSFPQRLKGYLRLYLQDFIVEEISTEEGISEIEPKETENLPPIPPFTLYADLVKTGISTSDAILSLSKNLNIRVDKIHVGGLKDIKAVTSQKIAFPNIDNETLEKIKKFSAPNFFLTNFSFGKGTIGPGQIFGNRFTIFIRTKEKIDKKWFSENLEKIKKEGFLNFYYSQRFGTPRFLSHHLGKLILQGNYKETIQTFLFKPGLKEIPLIKKIREKAEKLSPDWHKVEKVLNEFPYTFRTELRLLSFLKNNPRNFIEALIFLKDQTILWVYAYSSYLFNLLISLDKKLGLPEKVPLLVSDEPKDWEVYKFWLEKDEIRNFREAIRPFRFIISKRRFTKTKIFPQKVKFEILPEGLILSFILEKGAYATTLLNNLFEMKTGEPIPDWVKTDVYDIKKELEIGSIEKTIEMFSEDIVDFQKQKNEDFDL